MKGRAFALIFVCLLLAVGQATVSGQLSSSPQSAKLISVDVQKNLDQLMAEEDTDGDKKITIGDNPVKGERRGDKRFWLIAIDGKRYELNTIPSHDLHRFKPGDTLEMIARRHNTSVANLAEYNGIPIVTSVVEGQLLLVPQQQELTSVN